MPHTVQLVNPTAENNGDQGLDFDVAAHLIIQGGTVTGNGGRGIWAWATGPVLISDAVVETNDEDGILIEWNGVDPVDQVTMTNVTSNGNGVIDGSGIQITDVEGATTVTDCEASNNGLDGVIIGSPNSVRVEDTTANLNQSGNGIKIEDVDGDAPDFVEIIDCTANSNGLAGGGNGIYVKPVEGSVTIAGSTTNGNSRTGIRIDDLNGSALISHVISNNGLEEGIKIDADTGPVTIVGSTSDGNALEGIKIESVTIELEEVTLKRNLITNNDDAGVAFVGFGNTGAFDATCNDIAGNGFGFYLDGNVTIDARHVWWGHPSGPSGQGPGTGDGVFAEPGGELDFDPWLTESFTAPISGCPIFEADFESGTLAEWDAMAP